ncbi:thermitase [Emticicia aquatilis]|uniref:Thermitase n=1 Tax=Emticicia aquatilis TaxID=1537369 RepID=A0A916Z2G5_9BACT|nr:thermitase [Emticicia aquatilis]
MIIRVKENSDFNNSFEILKSRNLNPSKVFSFQNDPFEIERNFPIENLDSSGYLYDNEYYRKLGKRQKDYYRTYKIDFTDDESAKEYCLALQKNENIDDAYLDGYVHLATNPNDSLLSKQIALINIQCEQAWDISSGNPNIIVSVIDTGINDNHEDLRGNIFVDNTGKRGFNFTDDADFNDSRPDKGHGTCVAGLIAASWNNSRGIAGVAPNCRVINCKVFPTNDITAFFSDCQEAINTSIRNGAKILNCSWEINLDKDDKIVTDFIDFINKEATKSVFVFSSGNKNKNIAETAWSKLENCLIVGAMNINDNIWTENDKKGSNFGQNIIYSYGSGVFGLTNENNDSYNVLDSGTSFAAPHVSGICALILSYNPTISPKQVRDIIIDSREMVLGMSSTLGIGKVNALKALNLTQQRFAKLSPNLFS